MNTTAAETSPDGALRLIRVEHEGTVSVGFDGHGWHVHPDAIAGIYYYPETMSHAAALERFWRDILSDRLVISIEDDADGRYVEVVEDPDAVVAEGLQPGQRLRYWSGARYLGM